MKKTTILLTFFLNLGSLWAQTPSVTSVSITGNDSVLVGGTTTLTATVSVSNDADSTVTWSSSNINVATVDSTGKVRGIRGGTATITATSTFDNTKKASKTITVPTPTVFSVRVVRDESRIGDSLSLRAHIQFINSVDSVKIGDPLFLTTYVTYSNGYVGDVTWSSSDENVATVSDSGVVRGIRTGTVFITATSIYDSTKADTKKITVFTTYRIKGSGFVYLGETTSLTTEVIDATDGPSETVKWSSSDISKATVDSNTGVVTGVDTGKVTITAISTVNPIKIVTKTITIINSDSIFIKGPDTVWVGVTDTFSFSNDVDPTVTWSSSDINVAIVDPNTGVVRGIRGGTVTITATSTLGNTKKASKTITVPTPIILSVRVGRDISRIGDSISLRALFCPLCVPLDARMSDSLALRARIQFLYSVDPVRLGDSLFLRVYVSGEDKTVTWSSSDENVATVSRFGVVRGIRTGTVFITATSIHDSTKADTKKITVFTTYQIRGSDFVYLGETIPLTTEVIDTTDGPSETVKWSSSDIGIATVDSNTGVVRGIAAGTVTITATSTVNPIKIVTKTITIIDSISIEGPDTVWVRGTDTLSFSNDMDSTVTWSSSDINVAIVDSNTGVVRGIRGGTVTITATSTFGNTKKATKTITVPTPIIFKVKVGRDDSRIDNTLSIRDQHLFIYSVDSVRIGSLLALKAYVTYSNKNGGHANDVTWSSSDEDVATVSRFGVVQGIRIGTVSITATSIHDSTKAATRKITVFTTYRIMGSSFVYLGEAISLTAEIIDANRPAETVKWSSSDISKATVDSNTGVVTGVATGKVTITATSTVNPIKTVTKTITIINSDSIFIEGPDSVWVGETATLSFFNDMDSTVTWSSSNTNVATVDSTGLVRGIREGTVTITATSTFSNTKKATKTITVVDELTSIVYLNKVNLENTSVILYNTMGKRIEGASLRNLKEGIYFVQQKGSKKFTKAVIQ